MHEELNNALDPKRQKPRILFSFPFHLKDELKQAAATKNPVIFRKETTELSVVIDTLVEREADTSEEIVMFTGHTAMGEKVTGTAVQKLEALYIELGA